MGANLQSRNLDGNQIAWKYRRCAGHANLLFRDGVKRQVGKCDCLLEFTTKPELSQSRAESGHNSMCQNGLKILLRAIVRHGPKTGDLPSVWLDTCGSLPYQPDALARVAASPSQGFAGSKASRGQRLRGVKPCSGLRKAGRRPRTGFAGPFKGAGPLFGHRDLESRSPGRRSSGRAASLRGQTEFQVKLETRSDPNAPANAPGACRAGMLQTDKAAPLTAPRRGNSL